MTQHAPISLDALVGLYAVATGQLTHVNMGSCPDILEGAMVRDDECPACQSLLAADALLRDAGVILLFRNAALFSDLQDDNTLGPMVPQAHLCSPDSKPLP